MLGGGWGAPEPEEREPEAAASAPPPAPASRTIDIGLTDGIGPVDLGRIGIDRDSRDDPGDRGEATEHRE